MNKVFRLPLSEVEDLLKKNSIMVKASNGNWWKLRRTGKTILWITRPSEYRIPVKAGLKFYTYITHESLFCLPGAGKTEAPFMALTMCPRGAIFPANQLNTADA